MGAQKTRIGIIGAGAIGCVVGGLLARAGHDVTLADAWPEHVDQIKTPGLRLSGSCGEHVVPVRALHLGEMTQVREPFEAVFVAMKSYDTMLQDVMKGRRTEIDHLNGFVAAEGRRVGVPTPFNDAVVAAFHAHGVGHLKPGPRNLEPLVSLLS